MNENNTQNVILNVDSKSKEERNVPDLRFNSFENNWHEIEISTVIKEVNVKTSDFITYPLYSFTIEDGVTPKTDRYERGFLVKKEGELFKIINNNNFIMNPMNLRFGAINFSRINKPVSVSGYYDIFTIDNCNYNHFWNAYFKNNKTLHRYNQIATGSLEEKKRVYFNQFIKMKFKVPNNDEKRKINELISLIEQRVLTQKKIIKDIELLKKQLRNNIFTDDYSNFQPLKKLYIKGKAGGTPKTTNREYYDGDIPFLSITDITSSGKYIDNCLKKISIKGLENSSAWIVPVGSLILSMYASVGLPCINKIELATSQAMFSMILKKRINIDYIYEYLNYFKENKLEAYLEKGTQSNINSNIVENILIPLPDEQTISKIVNILTSIDKKIDNEKSILQLYIKQKEYLLNKLFI